MVESGGSEGRKGVLGRREEESAEKQRLGNSKGCGEGGGGKRKSGAVSAEIHRLGKV